MLVLNLLGVPEIQLNDNLVSLGTAKARALLFYLAVTGQPHSREQLLDLLWSDLPQAKARRNLTATLSSLRKEIEDYLLVEGEMVSFNTALPHFIDTAALSAALHTLNETGENSQLHDVVARYRGNFLAGLTVKNAFVFEEWVLTESSRIREQLVRALSYLLDTAVAQRKTAAALDYATKLLDIEPWLEQAHRQLMLLYARSGRLDAALAQYEKCQQILDDELAIEPAAETEALYERLRLARDEVAAPLPDDGTQFIGREEELTLILERVTQPACRLLTIVGLGGMGKTRLAVAAARQIMQGAERPFLNGAVFVSLVGTVGGEGLLSAILNALNETPTRGRLINQVIETLKQRELLLILDNFEELLAEINLIQQIIAACPDITLLVTSREALGISAEHRLDLDGMAVPPETITTAAAAAAYEAVALFTNIAQQVQPQFMLDETTAPHILAICRIVDGMPLALKLAATWLRALPLTDIVTQLGNSIDILATRLRDIPVRQRSMRAIFDQTMEMLIEEEATTLYGLAVFRGGFTTPAAQAVTNASPFVLSELVDRGLIQLGGDGRYQMHELLRQYAAAQADPAVQLAHATYYANWLAKLKEHLTDERQGEALRLIAIEVGNVTAAWRYALAKKRFDLLVQSAETLCRFARLRGRYPEGIADLEPAVEAAKAAGETAVVAELTDWLGTLYFFSGAHPKAMEAFQTALALAEQTKSTHTLANATLHLAQAYMFRENLEEARHLSEKAYQYYTEEDNPRGLIGVTNLLGQLFRKPGDVKKAHYWFEIGINLARQSRDYYALLIPLNNFGLLLHELGEYQESLRVFEECEEVVEKIGLGQDGLVIMNFGRNFEALGEIDKAAAAYLGAMPIFKSQHEQHFYLVAHTYASRAVRLQGDLSQARKLAQTALEGFRTTNIRFSIGNTLANLADVELADGQLSKAKKLYEEAEVIMRDLNKTDGQLRMVVGLAHLALLENQAIITQTHLEQALPLATKTHNVMYQYHLLAVLALYLIQQNQHERGAALLQWIQEQPRAFWETRRFAQQTAAEQLDPALTFDPIPPERPLAELFTLS